MSRTRREKIAAHLTQVLPVLVCAVAFFCPLSIAAASVAGGAAIGAWLGKGILRGALPRPDFGPMGTPVIAFLCAAVLAALLGIDPLRSFVGLRNYIWVILIPVAAEALADPRALRRLVWSSLTGLGIAAYHTCANHYAPFLASLRPPGAMTESGQLVLGLALAGALWLDARTVRARGGWLALLVLFGGALVFNMKRGPWLGASVAMLALAASRRRMAVIAILLAGLVLLPAYGPARKRLFESGRDFLHADNRFHMWSIAADIVPRYPFGVGVYNGTVMQSARYGPDAPRHRHFHNNFVTILVESGVLGLGAFLWWMSAFGLLVYRTYRAAKAAPGFDHAFPLGVFCGFLGWNVAGLLEFNFGDTEIVLWIYLLMGGALAVSRLPGDRRDERIGDPDVPVEDRQTVGRTDQELRIGGKVP